MTRSWLWGAAKSFCFILLSLGVVPVEARSLREVSSSSAFRCLFVSLESSAVCAEVREQPEGGDSPANMWVLGLKLRSSGSVASAFTHCALVSSV